ncbi:MAG TPA: CGNR zinc finger domain-containing protein [Solirubrobacterales bacterium]|nr:CGNR zinc finger domain-containing protein [Solirubrobacterales bacterium]
MAPETRVCENPGCDKRFIAKNPRRRFCSDDCRFEAWDQSNPRTPREDRTTVDAHPLDEVRAQHEESKGRWTVIVREHLNRTLIETGYVNAEDFDALGIPAEHSNLANAQMGGYVNAGYMEAISWRRSTKPSRKSGKIWVYKITKLGREKLAGVGADSCMRSSQEARGVGEHPPVSADPGEHDESTSGVQREDGGAGADLRPAASGGSLHPGGASPAAPPDKGTDSEDGESGPSASSESAAQLPGMEPSPYDQLKDAA